MPILAIYPSTRGLSSIGKHGFQQVFYDKISKKTNFSLHGEFRPLPKKNVQIWDHFFLLLFPKDSESLKFLDIGLQKMGAKRRNSKVNIQTNGQTNRRTDRHFDLQKASAQRADALKIVECLGFFFKLSNSLRSKKNSIKGAKTAYKDLETILCNWPYLLILYKTFNLNTLY